MIRVSGIAARASAALHQPDIDRRRREWHHTVYKLLIARLGALENELEEILIVVFTAECSKPGFCGEPTDLRPREIADVIRAAGVDPDGFLLVAWDYGCSAQGHQCCKQEVPPSRS